MRLKEWSQEHLSLTHISKTGNGAGFLILRQSLWHKRSHEPTIESLEPSLSMRETMVESSMVRAKSSIKAGSLVMRLS